MKSGCLSRWMIERLVTRQGSAGVYFATIGGDLPSLSGRVGGLAFAIT